MKVCPFLLRSEDRSALLLCFGRTGFQRLLGFWYEGLCTEIKDKKDPHLRETIETAKLFKCAELVTYCEVSLQFLYRVWRWAMCCVVSCFRSRFC